MHTMITVSRQLGSRGSYIATEVAKRLKARYVDREVLRRAAESAGFNDEAMLALLEQEDQLPTLTQMLVEKVQAQPLVPAVASATIRESYAFDDQVHELMDAEALDYDAALKRAEEVRDKTITSLTYAQLVRRVFKILAAESDSDVVLVGRGGQVILKDHSSAIHLRIYAPLTMRSWRLQQRLGIGEKQAERELARSDQRREHYLREFFDHAWGNPDLYDLSINTGRLSTNAATELVLNLVQSKSKQMGLLPGM